MNTDEIFDAWVCRPLGARFAAFVAPRTRMTANQVSVLSAVFGVIGGAMMAGRGWWPAAGAGFLFVMMVLDCADGELARRRGGGDWRGRVIDGVADLATAWAVHTGMAIAVARLIPGGMLIGLSAWIVSGIAGFSMSWNAAAVDGLKQRLKSASVDRQLEDAKATVNGLGDKLMYAFLCRYVRQIEKAAGSRGDGDAERFKLAQFVGPTHHHLAMMLAAIAASAGAGDWAFAAYFALAIGPANLFLAAVLARRGKGVAETA